MTFVAPPAVLAVDMAAIINAMNDWLNELSQRDNFTLVRYETLRASPAEHFRDLLEVLGESQPDGTFFQDALEFSRFENMKLSKRGEYALRALIDLGIASELGWPMLQISELASKEKLPIKFLEQIFTQLKAAGYVKSRRGKFGGYSLARPMNRIKFGEIIRLIEGPLAPIRCVSQTSYARCSCPDEAHCGLRILMIVIVVIGLLADKIFFSPIEKFLHRRWGTSQA